MTEIATNIAGAGTLDAIERTITLPAPRERVWRAITDPDELAQWFPEKVELDLRPGGDGQFTWQEHGAYAVQVVAFEPPTYFAWRWSNEAGVSLEQAGEKTLVEWWLDEAPDGGTTLRLRESGFTRPTHRAGNDEGWGEELAELVALLA